MQVFVCIKPTGISVQFLLAATKMNYNRIPFISFCLKDLLLFCFEISTQHERSVLKVVVVVQAWFGEQVVLIQPQVITLQINCYLRVARSMHDIGNPQPPTIQQLDFIHLNQTIPLRFQTSMNEVKLNSSQIREQFQLQNYFCYKTEKQLIKVTKVKLGEQLFTIVDKLSLKKDKVLQKANKRYQKASNNEPQIGVWGESILTPSKYKILEMFCEWLQKNKPQIKPILDQVFRSCHTQLDLQAQMRQNIELRVGLIAFKKSLKPEKADRNTYKVLRKWLREAFQQDKPSKDEEKN